MRRRALLASVSATQSNINPEFAFEWHLQYPEEGNINIDAKDDENVVKAFDTLARIHTVLGENLDGTTIPREFNLTVNGIRLSSSFYYYPDGQMLIAFDQMPDFLYFGTLIRDNISIFNAYG